MKIIVYENNNEWEDILDQISEPEFQETEENIVE